MIKRVIVSKLTRELGLTRAQRSEASRIVDEVQLELRARNSYSRPALEQAVLSRVEAWKSSLSPQQRERADVLLEQAKARWMPPAPENHEPK